MTDRNVTGLLPNGPVFANQTTELLHLDNRHPVNFLNETIPDTKIFVIVWWAYFVFLICFTVYCILMAYKLYSVIIETQNGCVGKAYGCAVATLVVTFMVAIGAIIRWMTLYTTALPLIYFLLAFDVVICILELIWLFIKSACSPGAALCHLVFLTTMDLVEIMILGLMLHEVKTWCRDLDDIEGSVCV